MIRKFRISLPEFVWVIEKTLPSVKKIYSEVVKLYHFLPSTFSQTAYNYNRCITFQRKMDDDCITELAVHYGKTKYEMEKDVGEVC